MMRVIVPVPLRHLADLADEVQLDLQGQASLKEVLDALEERYPALKGTLRQPESGQRCGFIRFYAGGQDLSNQDMLASLPAEVTSGREALRIVAAMAGG